MNQSRFTRLFVHPIVLAAALLLAPTGANAKEAPAPKQATNLQTKGLAQTTAISEKALETQFDVAPVQLSQVPSVEELSRPQAPSQSQVTSVSQLSDVQPTDWAFQALQSLVERYGCIAGYPDGTFRGSRATTRYEFAAGLNACLDQILNLVGDVEGGVSEEDLAAIRRLQEEFAAELATLRGRVDALEARTAELEANQFSTTTKLVGEVAFILADSFGGDGTPDGDDESQTIFADRVRLQLVSSFTGKDKLFTRLTAGNIGNSFTDEIGTFEGRFAFDGQNGNDITIDRLHYVFPVGDKLTVTAMASAGGHHFYAPTFNPGLEAGGGTNGALSRFAERNPIYRIGLGGQGIGLNYQFNDKVGLQAGYLARGGNNPSQGAGLFNGNYSIMGQLAIEPTDKVSVGLTYVHGYDPAAGRRFTFGGTGTNLGRLNAASLNDIGVEATEVISNSYGAQVLFNVSPKFRVGGWVGFTDLILDGLGGDPEVWNYAMTLSFPDLGVPGALGAVIAGAEPYLGGLNGIDNDGFENDTPFHIEALYKVPVSDGIFITPGGILLLNPNQDSDNDSIFIGTLRTTFKF